RAAGPTAVPHLGKGLLQYPQTRRPRLRGHGLDAAFDDGGAAAEHDAAAADHSAAAEHDETPAHHSPPPAHDDVDPDANAGPGLGKGLLDPPQPRPRLRGLDGSDNRGAMERHATAKHDAVDAGSMPRLGQELHPRPQPRPGLRGFDAGDNRGAVERLDADADRGAVGRHDSARPAQLLPGADPYPPSPQRADHSASAPAVLSAARSHLKRHRADR